MNKEKFEKWYEQGEKTKEDYREWYAKGEKMMDEWNFPAAIKLFTRTIELNPDFDWSYLHRGLCYHGLYHDTGKADQLRKANFDYEKYLELDPEAHEKEQIIYFLGMNYALLMPADDLSTSKAIDYLTRAIENNPQLQKAYEYRATARILAIENMISQRPEVRHLLNLTHFEEIISDCSKLIELNPGNELNYSNLEGLLRTYFEPGYRIVCYTNLLSRFPSNFFLHVFRGIAYEEIGEHESALADLDKAIELNPKHSGAYSLRGSIYGILKQFELALKDSSEAIKLEPDCPVLVGNLATTYFFMGDIDRTILELKRAVSLCCKPQYKDLKKRYSLRLKHYENINKDGLTDLEKAELLKKEMSAPAHINPYTFTINKFVDERQFSENINA